MKRYKPLRRKTPMKRISDKRREKMKGYHEFVEFMLLTHPRCEFMTCMRKSRDPHHLLPLSLGGALMDPNNVKMICSQHHRHIHDHANWARENGWLFDKKSS